MVHSRKLKSNNLLSDTREVLLAHVIPGNHLTIALSGGIDSVVLLHVLSELTKQLSFTLSAVHVNHGISSNSFAWSRFCSDLCRNHGIPVHIAYMKLKKVTGTSLEAVARTERYRIFSHIKADHVVLAQHLDDQAETFFLQLLRGAGIKGLSAMPVIRKQSADGTPTILRPLLKISRDEIEAYASQHKLNWITDESNNDTSFERNFLRHDILPLLKKRYPSYAKTLYRSTGHLAEASVLLDDLAALDAMQCSISGKLSIDRLRQLSLPRAKNLLRYTLLQHNADLPSSARLNNILQQLFSTDADTRLHVKFGNSEIRCFQGRVYILHRKVSLQEPEHLIWHGEECLTLMNGTINFVLTRNQGISQEKINNAQITLRSRKGGEYFTPAHNRPRKSLKKLLQEAFIPPWERKILPLLFCGERLIWVPGIGIDYEFQVESGETGIVPIWRPE